MSIWSDNPRMFLRYGLTTQPAFLVRGSPRRIMIMRECETPNIKGDQPSSLPLFLSPALLPRRFFDAFVRQKELDSTEALDKVAPY